MSRIRRAKPKSRYLPGEVDVMKEKADHRMFTEHRTNVMHATAKIDNKAPAFKPSVYLRQRKLDDDLTRIARLDKDNEDLLMRINTINHTGGVLDCWNLNVKYESHVADEETNKKKRLTKMNKTMLKRIVEAEAAYSTASFLKDWKRIEAIIELKSRYPLTWKDPKFLTLEAKRRPSIVNELSSFRPRVRPRCFFNIELAESGQKLGRIIFELYPDLVPRTCEKFLTLCQGENGLSYKGTPFHRILPGYWCQGGDVVKFNGSGGDLIYEESFENENSSLKHTGPGVLSNVNGSKFNLTFERLETMDGKRVVFGKIVVGLANLYKIEEQGTRSGKPLKKVIVSECGVLPSKGSKTVASLRQTGTNEEEAEE